jgi:nitrate reductase gamma subunit
MSVLLHLTSYAAVLVFAIAIAARYWRIRHYPINLRWEIYPVPHEGKRAAHGGSRMEDSEYWTHDDPPDRMRELRFMIPEMIFIKGLFDHNRKLWYPSFSFHFGLYLTFAFGCLLLLGTILGLTGVQVAEPGAAGPVILLNSLTAVVGVVGLILTILGGLGLLAMRLSDPELKPYTNGSHVFNLLFIIGTMALMLAALSGADSHLVPLRAYLTDLLTLKLTGPVADPLTGLAVAAISLLVAYIPLTHMSHFFVKWFTWHRIRWDDEPNVRGGRIEVMIQQALNYPVSWPADHIKGDGKKTWADVATEEIQK